MLFLLHYRLSVASAPMESSHFPSVSSHLFRQVEDQTSQNVFASENHGHVQSTNAVVLQASVKDPANIEQLHDFDWRELERIFNDSILFPANFSMDGRGVQPTQKDVAKCARKKVDPSSSRFARNESERQRRRSLSRLFTTIRSLLPMPHAQTADNCTTISLAINHIESLQQQLEDLKKKRTQLLEYYKSINSSRENNTYSGPLFISGCGKRREGSMPDSCVLSMAANSGKKAKSMQQKIVSHAAVFFNANSATIILASQRMADIFSRVMELLEEHRLEVRTASVSQGEGVVLFSILANVVDDKITIKEAFSQALQELTKIYYRFPHDSSTKDIGKLVTID